MESIAALSYEESSIVTILIQASFLLLLNIVNFVLDKIIYCGLIGQIFIGIAWGRPGAGWLSTEVQETIMQLGYLGLILIVYESKILVSVIMGLGTDYRQVGCQPRFLHSERISSSLSA